MKVSSEILPTNKIENTNELTKIKTLTAVGFLEGISFLLLLGVAMPVRYYFDYSELVRYIGMAHGFLFMAFLLVLLSTWSKVNMPLWGIPLGIISALLPFGPFIFDYLLKKSLVK
jgi:integral membrane protein